MIGVVLIDQEKYHTNEVDRKIRTTVGLQLLLVEAHHNLLLLSCTLLPQLIKLNLNIMIWKVFRIFLSILQHFLDYNK